MSRPLRTLLLLCLAALAVGGLAAQPAMAKEKAKEACWKTLINDWYDGVIDDKYKLHCYREAIARLDSYPDLNNYSTAREDINRAYQARIAEIQKSRNQAKTPPKSNDPDENAQHIPAVVCPCPAPPPTGPGSQAVTPPTPPVTDPPTLPTKNEKPTPQVTETPPKVVRLPTSPQPSTQPGRKNPDGPIPAAIAKLGPDDADSLPIPLLVLGGLALVLMLGGILGFVARRVQSRRPPMQPATAPAETRRR